MKKLMILTFTVSVLLCVFTVPAFAADGTQQFNWGNAIIIGIIGGLIAAIITACCIVYNYKKKLRSEKYPLNRYAQLELTHSRDTFTGSIITKRRINRNKK